MQNQNKHDEAIQFVPEQGPTDAGALGRGLLAAVGGNYQNCQ